MISRREGLKSAVAAPMLLAAPRLAVAQQRELTLGLGATMTSMDPLFYNSNPDFNVALNIYDRLIMQDERQRLQPALVTAWKTLDDNTWELTLRRGVRFHDGSSFGAEDVMASIRRVSWVPNSIGPLTVYTRAIIEMIAVDEHTLRLKTAAPHPLMPIDLSMISVISRRHEQAPTAEFNSGRAAIGTGPFKQVSYAQGDRILLARNDDYWGDRPQWQKVTLRLMPNGPVRLAALLAGDIDAMDILPPTDLGTLRNNANVTVARTQSNAVLFLHLDSFRDQTPFATDKSGTVLSRNPLKDVRVRRAISKAVNRQAICERVMEGAATPAGFILAGGFFGVSSRLKPDDYDPEGARKLLAEAGYPDGFALTVHGPRDRFINDEKVLQAVGQMLVRIGIDTKVVVQPWQVFATQASTPNYAYSVMLVANYATTGEASFPLRAQVATVDPQKGMGAQNRARYSNPRIDALLARAMTTIDDAKREALLFEATETAMADQANIPLFAPDNLSALRKGLQFVARADGLMAAQMVKLVG